MTCWSQILASSVRPDFSNGLSSFWLLWPAASAADRRFARLAIQASASLYIKAQQAAGRLGPEPGWQPDRKRGPLLGRQPQNTRRRRFTNFLSGFARTRRQANLNGHEVASRPVR